jgi:hypothetical protein
VRVEERRLPNGDHVGALDGEDEPVGVAVCR